MEITFFAKPAWWAASHGYMKRVSSIIRADQIADRIGAKVNPESGYEDDVCIYVKPHIRDHAGYKFAGQRSYLDIIDGWKLIGSLRAQSKLVCIACSKKDKETLERETSSKIIFIPQHHCNFDRETKEHGDIKKIGLIGTASAGSFVPEELKQGIKDRGLELVEFAGFTDRLDIVDFYKNIDLQLVWRPYKKWLANPLKIVNAASFGVPTIALDEPHFAEVEGCYVPVKDIDGFFQNLEAIRSSSGMYEKIMQTCLLKAEDYHIDKIAEMYKAL